MSTTAKWVIAIIVIIIIIAGIWTWQKGGSTTPAQTASSTGPIKVGVIFPLTGDFSSYGEGWRNVISLVAENSGLKDKVQFVIEDDSSCTLSQDLTIAHKMIDIDGVKAILGPICSSGFLAILPVTEQNKVMLGSFSATSKSITGAGKYVFRTVGSDADKALKIADFAYGKGHRKAALFYDSSNDTFVQQRKDVKEEFTKLGGQIVADESFQGKDTDFKSQLAKIKKSGADVLFVGFFPAKEGTIVLKQAKELGIRMQIMSSSPELGAPDFIKLAGQLSENLIFPFDVAPASKEYTDFIIQYKNKFGKDSVTYSAEVYDAAVLVSKAVSASDGTPDGIKDQLYKLGQNYNGASGLINFESNGDVKKPIIIKVVKNGEPVEYK